MADQVTITNMPDGGSTQRVAYDLWFQTRTFLPKKEGLERIKQALDLYEQCLNATNRGRVDTSGLT